MTRRTHTLLLVHKYLLLNHAHIFTHRFLFNEKIVRVNGSRGLFHALTAAMRDRMIQVINIISLYTYMEFLNVFNIFSIYNMHTHAPLRAIIQNSICPLSYKTKFEYRSNYFPQKLLRATRSFRFICHRLLRFV